jgi:hypothetical protein
VGSTAPLCAVKKRYVNIPKELQLLSTLGKQVWWYMPVIPTLGRMKQGNLEFKARLGYIVRSCLKKSRAGQA